MKKISAKQIGAIALLSYEGWLVNAHDIDDFMQGVQTGMFLDSESIVDYSCPEPIHSDSLQQYTKIASTFKNLLSFDMPVLFLAIEGALQTKKLQDVFDDNYDGGDFCIGLWFGVESTELASSVYDFYTSKGSTMENS